MAHHHHRDDEKKKAGSQQHPARKRIASWLFTVAYSAPRGWMMLMLLWHE